jgi:type IV pilus biogenesis protein CpaD/CtpE
MAFMMLFSCQNDQTSANPTNAIAKRGCASQEVLAAQLAADPTLVLRMNEIEAFTQK